jgi:acyl-CoA synthetase (AMP-forming)/AMP-acid ligase II
MALAPDDGSHEINPSLDVKFNMNIAALLQKSAIQHGDRPALTVHDRVHANYREFAQRVRAMAFSLRHRLGLKTGDRVAIAMSNRPEFFETLFAIWHAGLIGVPVNAKLHSREFEYILANAQARLCFASPELIESMAHLPAQVPELEHVISTDSADYDALMTDDELALADVAPTDPAWLFYTSGTTGRPKGATLTHRNLLAMTLSYFADIDPISPFDTIIHAAPMSHGSGLYGLPHIAKAANNVVPASAHFDPAEIWQLVKIHPGVSLFAAPTMVKRLVENDTLAPSEHLKALIYGGAPMYRADLERALDLIGPRLVQIYGQGESPMTICALSKQAHADRHHPRFRERLGSVGLPRTDVELRIVDPGGMALAPGEAGEITVRGDVVMAGYWNDPQATAQTLRDGWLHTGDVGCFDANGFVTLMDRSKDLIISGGSNIYPREIEEVLLRHPGVAQVSVVGRPDPEWGEGVVALVVATPGMAVGAEALDALCLDNMARFKRPKRYHFVAALPTNNYGKVLKTELRELLGRLDSPAQSTPTKAHHV